MANPRVERKLAALGKQMQKLLDRKQQIDNKMASNHRAYLLAKDRTKRKDRLFSTSLKLRAQTEEVEAKLRAIGGHIGDLEELRDIPARAAARGGCSIPAVTFVATLLGLGTIVCSWIPHVSR